eukprot:5879565-Prymnesium_polylepis.1
MSSTTGSSRTPWRRAACRIVSPWRQPHASPWPVPALLRSESRRWRLQRQPQQGRPATASAGAEPKSDRGSAVPSRAWAPDGPASLAPDR